VIRSQVKITGVQEVIRAIGKARAKTRDDIATTLERCGQVVLKKADQYCPEDKGNLRKSGKVVTTGKGMGARAAVEYGGDEAPYALYVHENLDAFHLPPTQAKWLERAVRESRGTISNMLKRETTAEKVKTIDGEVVK
jgi:hypothetical protein